MAARSSRDKNLFLPTFLLPVGWRCECGCGCLSPLSRAVKIEARHDAYPCRCRRVLFLRRGNDARRWTTGKLTFWIIKFSISIAISHADVRRSPCSAEGDVALLRQSARYNRRPRSRHYVRKLRSISRYKLITQRGETWAHMACLYLDRQRAAESWREH